MARDEKIEEGGFKVLSHEEKGGDNPYSNYYHHRQHQPHHHRPRQHSGYDFSALKELSSYPQPQIQIQSSDPDQSLNQTKPTPAKPEEQGSTIKLSARPNQKRFSFVPIGSNPLSHHASYPISNYPSTATNKPNVLGIHSLMHPKTPPPPLPSRNPHNRLPTRQGGSHSSISSLFTHHKKTPKSTPSSPPPLPSRPEMEPGFVGGRSDSTSGSSAHSYLPLTKSISQTIPSPPRQPSPPPLSPKHVAFKQPQPPSLLNRPAAQHLQNSNLQKRTSISRLTMLGLDTRLGKTKGVNHPGLLSEIVHRFKRTSQEVMTGSQIMDFIEKAASIPPKDRLSSHLICEALQHYGIFKHTGDDELPVLDGDEEIYVVDIGRLQNPNFTPRSVLTQLTRCYYPTCTAVNPCSSSTCPTNSLFYRHQLGELKVVNSITTTLSSPKLPIVTEALEPIREVHHSKQQESFDSQSSTNTGTLSTSGGPLDGGLDKFPQEAELWAHAVPKEVFDRTPDDEKKRQELIFETIKTELDYVNDLKLIDKIFVQKMRSGEVYDPNRVDAVLYTLFSNYQDILKINQELLNGLQELQRREYVVSSIGEIFLGWALSLDSYVKYGSRLAYAQDFIKKELEYNPTFAQYLKECERHPEARRLSIQSFVGRATTRLGRYPLLLEGILKKTQPKSADKILIPQALDLVRSNLEEVNRSAGEAEERLKLSYISSHLYFKPEDSTFDIDLENPSRKLIKEGVLRRAVSHGSQAVTVFLFDNCMVLAKEKKKVVTEYRAVCPAIPIYAMQYNDEVSSRSFRLAENLLMTQKSPTNDMTTNGSMANDSSGFGFSVTRFGKRSLIHCLVASSARERSGWIEAIQSAQDACPQVNNSVLQLQEIYQSHASQNHILSSTQCTIRGEEFFLFGCDNGVYVLTQAGALKRIIKSTTRVVQLEAITEYHLLAVLFGDKYLMAYHLDVVNDTTGKFATISTKLSENVNFFRIGICSERRLLISAKYHSQKSNFKTIQLVHMNNESKASQKNKLLWQSRHGTGLRVIKKFYVGTIGNGISFLKTKLVIACGPGFEIVDLEALYLNRGIPDRANAVIANNPKFVALFENCTPLAMYRINPNEFLLCYKEFGFYVDNNGRPSRDINSHIDWEGAPTDFVFAYPHVITFDPNMIEVRRADTGVLVQLLLCNALQFSNPSQALGGELHCISDTHPPGAAAGGAIGGQRFFRLELQISPSDYGHLAHPSFSY